MSNQGQRSAFVRLVAWNIEKGKRWDMLEKCLEVEAIRTCDILCLNEVDDGMARSRNLDVAGEIGARLGMRVLFGPAFKELTKGIGEERLAPGENTRAVQGNAVLTRLPILDSDNFKLPVCRDYSVAEEKRFGGRHGLIARLDCGGARTLTVASTHLEVYTTARCRARQMRALIQRIGSGPAIIAGDFNTNTFDRGSAWHTFRSLVRLMAPGIKRAVMEPWTREDLFDELQEAGFSWQEFNDNIPTCSVDLGSIEDRRYVPAPIRRRILKRVRELPLRLDWIAARGVEPCGPGRTITELPCQPSDHLPIMCDFL
jgi:endonuclease/exonuclease/phosphatase family metal-dependent hydrolase